MAERVPTITHIARGTHRADRHGPAPKPVSARPSAPSWLDPEGRREWKRIVPELERLGIIGKIDRAALAAYCSAWSAFVSATSLLAAEGLIVEGRNAQGASLVRNPAWIVRRQAEMSMVTLGRELGLTPRARQGMDVGDSPDDPRAAWILD